MLKNIYKYKTLIFDFDGVIVESVKIKEEVYCQLFSQLLSSELDVLKSYIRQNSHISREEKINYIFNNISRNNYKNLDQLNDLFTLILFSKFKEIKPINGLKAFLNSVTNANKIILSAAPKHEILNILKQNKIENFFDEVYGSIKEKGIAIKEIQKHGIRKKEMIFIGDKLSDLNSAIKGEIDFIGRISEFDPTCFPEKILTFKDFTEFI